jgi:hypothetical protein
MEHEDKERPRLTASEEFAIARAKGIDFYAHLELNLGLLFDALLAGDSRMAFAAFGAMQTNRKRLIALSKMLGLTYGDKYELFFDSLSRKINGLDGSRNKIVHWSSWGSGENVFLSEHPDIFGRSRFELHEIKNFEKKVGVLQNFTFYFGIYIKNPAFLDDGPPKQTPWREIFQRPIDDPLPADHPLAQTPKARSCPPRP